MRQEEAQSAAAAGQVERRTRVRSIVNELLTERQALLVSFCELAGRNTRGSPNGSARKALAEFCQILVDYTALGHFELFERIITGNERRRAVQAVAERVYPAIARTTDVIVDFNDKYDGSEGPDAWVELERELSTLGQALAERFELEDQLLGSLDRRGPAPE